jgi:hypothetical protein
LLVYYAGREPEVTVPTNIEGLGDGCFQKHSGITQVRFDSVSRISQIPQQAFLICESLKEIRVPAAVVPIGEEAFNCYLRLSNVIFEAGSKLARIGESAFSAC